MNFEFSINDEYKNIKVAIEESSVEAFSGFHSARISPELAQQILDVCNRGNRPKRQGPTKKYAQKMLKGRWRLSPDCIAIDVDGKLVNGQHRLQAVVLCGKPQDFLFMLDVPRYMGRICDQGATRNGRDLLHFAGHYVNANMESIMISALMRKYSGTMDKDNIEKIYVHFQDCFDFAANLKYKVPVNLAQFKAAVACAAYHCRKVRERNKIQRLVELMSGGIPKSPEENVVLAWRQKILDCPGAWSHLANSQPNRHRLLIQFQYVIKYFLEGKKRLPGWSSSSAKPCPTEEVYPMPIEELDYLD